MSTMSQFLGSSPIKSIQRGTASSGNRTNWNVTISAVNLNKSFLSVNGRNGTGMTSFSDSYGTVQLTTTTNINFQRGTAGSTITICWEVIEYV